MKRKICSGCGKPTNPEEFPELPSGRKRRRCLDCQRHDKIKKRDEAVRKFGLEPGQYQQMLKDQEYRCAICSRTAEETGRSLAVDHNHRTGKIRGLLCGPCNTALGMLQENPRFFKRAIIYLQQDVYG